MDSKWIIFALCLQVIHGLDARNFTVAVVERKPWSFNTPSGWQGFLIDLLDELSEQLNFSYRIQRATGNQNGHFNSTTRTFDGLIGDVVNARVDLGISDLSITDPWSGFVTFTRPFINTGVNIIIKRPQKVENNVWILSSPFSARLWVLLVFIGICRVTAVWALKRSSRDDRDSPTNGSVNKRIDSCLRGRHHLKSCPARLLSGVWWIFVILVISAYTVTLAGWIMAQSSYKPMLPFRTFEEMSKQSSIAFGGWLGMTFNPNNDLQRTLSSKISNQNSYYQNIEEAVERVRNEHFAAIVPSLQGKFIANQQCDIMMLEDQLYITGYGIACGDAQTKNETEQICEILNFGILKLREGGDVDMIQRRWFNDKGICPKAVDEELFSNMDASSNDILVTRALDIPDLVFAFLILAIGLVLWIVFILIKTFCKCCQSNDKRMVV